MSGIFCGTMTVPMSETSFAVIVSFNTSISIGTADCSHVEFHNKPKLKKFHVLRGSGLAMKLEYNLISTNAFGASLTRGNQKLKIQRKGASSSYLL